MGATVSLNNSTNFIINTALCIIIRYYEANQINPGVVTRWDSVGYVYFSVVTVPWYGPSSEFGNCQGTYHDFTNRISELATNVSKFGHGSLGYFTITGKNVTYNEAEDRIRNLAYWGDGFKVAGKTIEFSGGPPAYLVKDREIDVSEHFDPIRISIY